MGSQRMLGYILTFTAATCWALTGILGKISIQDANLSGYEVAFWRAVMGGGMFMIHAFVSGKWRVEPKYALAFALFGIPGVAGPVLRVVGSEGQGLARLVRDNCDVLVSIPIGSDVESLNASVAAALAMFEWARSNNVNGQ